MCDTRYWPEAYADLTSLDNMSLSPRSEVVIAPRRKVSVGLRFALVGDPTAALSKLGATEADWLAKTEALLDGIAAPAAAPLLEIPARTVDDPLLAIAVLSRCSANLFLRNRTPRFDAESLGRQVSFAVGVFSPPNRFFSWLSP
jgi:hypothetical protein